jgi:hypothetical protein
MFTIAQAPPEILTALREIDPKADLVCVGDGFWWLGVREPNPAAVEALAKEVRGDQHGAVRLQQDREQYREEAGFRLTNPTAGTRFAMLQVMADGFKPIHLYECERPGYEIVQDFRLRDHNWRTRPDEAFEEMRDAHVSLDAANDRKTGVLLDFVKQEMGYLWHQIFRRRQHFHQRRAFPTGDV